MATARCGALGPALSWQCFAPGISRHGINPAPLLRRDEEDEDENEDEDGESDEDRDDGETSADLASSCRITVTAYEDHDESDADSDAESIHSYQEDGGEAKAEAEAEAEAEGAATDETSANGGDDGDEMVMLNFPGLDIMLDRQAADAYGADGSGGAGAGAGAGRGLHMSMRLEWLGDLRQAPHSQCECVPRCAPAPLTLTPQRLNLDAYGAVGMGMGSGPGDGDGGGDGDGDGDGGTSLLSALFQHGSTAQRVGGGGVGGGGGGLGGDGGGVSAVVSRSALGAWEEALLLHTQHVQTQEAQAKDKGAAAAKQAAGTYAVALVVEIRADEDADGGDTTTTTSPPCLGYIRVPGSLPRMNLTPASLNYHLMGLAGLDGPTATAATTVTACDPSASRVLALPTSPLTSPTSAGASAPSSLSSPVSELVRAAWHGAVCGLPRRRGGLYSLFEDEGNWDAEANGVCYTRTLSLVVGSSDSGADDRGVADMAGCMAILTSLGLLPNTSDSSTAVDNADADANANETDVGTDKLVENAGSGSNFSAGSNFGDMNETDVGTDKPVENARAGKGGGLRLVPYPFLDPTRIAAASKESNLAPNGSHRDIDGGDDEGPFAFDGSEHQARGGDGWGSEAEDDGWGGQEGGEGEVGELGEIVEASPAPPPPSTEVVSVIARKASTAFVYSPEGDGFDGAAPDEDEGGWSALLPSFATPYARSAMSSPAPTPLERATNFMVVGRSVDGTGAGLAVLFVPVSISETGDGQANGKRRGTKASRARSSKRARATKASRADEAVASSSSSSSLPSVQVRVCGVPFVNPLLLAQESKFVSLAHGGHPDGVVGGVVELMSRGVVELSVELVATTPGEGDAWCGAVGGGAEGSAVRLLLGMCADQARLPDLLSSFNGPPSQLATAASTASRSSTSPIHPLPASLGGRVLGLSEGQSRALAAFSDGAPDGDGGDGGGAHGSDASCMIFVSGAPGSGRTTTCLAAALQSAMQPSSNNGGGVGEGVIFTGANLPSLIQAETQLTNALFNTSSANNTNNEGAASTSGGEVGVSLVLYSEEAQVLTKINDVFSAITAQGLDPEMCEVQAKSAVAAYHMAEQELATATIEYNGSGDGSNGPNSANDGLFDGHSNGPRIPYQLRLNRLNAAKRNVGTAASSAARLALMAVRVRAIASPTPQVKAALALLRKILRNRSTSAANSGQAGGTDGGEDEGGHGHSSGGGGAIGELRAMAGWQPLLKAVAPIIFGTPTAIDTWLPSSANGATASGGGGDGDDSAGAGVSMVVVDDGVGLPWHHVASTLHNMVPNKLLLTGWRDGHEPALRPTSRPLRTNSTSNGRERRPMRSAFHALTSVVSSDDGLVDLPTSFRCDGKGGGGDSSNHGQESGLLPMSRSVQRAVNLLSQVSSPTPTTEAKASRGGGGDGDDDEANSTTQPVAIPIPPAPRVRCVGGSWRASRIPNRIRDALLTVQEVLGRPLSANQATSVHQSLKLMRGGLVNLGESLTTFAVLCVVFCCDTCLFDFFSLISPLNPPLRPLHPNPGEAMAVVRSAHDVHSALPHGTSVGVVSFSPTQTLLIKTALSMSSTDMGSVDVTCVTAPHETSGLTCDVLLVSLTQPHNSQSATASGGTTGANGAANSARGAAAVTHLSHLVQWCARWHSLIFVSGGGGRGVSGAKCGARFMSALNKAAKPNGTKTSNSRRALANNKNELSTDPMDPTDGVPGWVSWLFDGVVAQAQAGAAPLHDACIKQVPK